MVPKKRRYAPKVKGCYECSQRRINCDRDQPQCKKCIARGIVCSGLGVRYRFHVNGAVSRKELPDTECLHPKPVNWELRSISTPSHDQHAEANPESNKLADCPLTPNPYSLPPETQFFFDHFSKSISAEMVIFDDTNNGWRQMMLPIGQRDSLVMNAIMAASAFHLAANVHDRFLTPSNRFYTRAILELKRRQSFEAFDKTSAQYTVMGLLILLAAVMVTGWQDFPYLFRMMEFALLMIGGEEKLAGDELGEFLSREIKKMRVYASPLIDQKQGALMVQSQAVQSFECLRHYCALHPELIDSFSIVGDLIQQAYRIYLHRVSHSKDYEVSQQLVGHYRDTLRSFHPDSAGAHVLVWATYIVALESRDPEHRADFTDFLLHRHKRSGFQNITIALERLRQIWSRSENENWTYILPESRIFIM